MKKKAFITGINGQDGSYLAELLLEKDYEVYGIVRRHSIAEHQESRIDSLVGNGVETFYGDLTDISSLERLIRTIQPDEIYNIAAQSHVRISFDIPQYTVQANALGIVNILEAWRNNCPTARFYQASSSEMFGRSVDDDGYQRETTAMNPTSPYGCTKVFGFNMTQHYRHAYKLFASNGILFNHESPRRGSNFVTNKVVKAAVEISLGKRDKLPLGNLDAFRDWGHSKDYVRAMHMIINHTEPDDFVCATGITNSVGGMCDYVFNKVGLNYKDYVTVEIHESRRVEISPW
jgi:GDPmannose 4,6-dehydratase